jgi:rhamnosyltransferase
LSSGLTTPPRVLVLLASHNGAPWLRQQIDSILAQAGVAVDLIVGDDASVDATARLLREGWPGESRIRCKSWDVSSGSAGANFRRLFRAVDSAGYDFVALADQDDIWHPDKLARALDALDRHDAQGYSAAVEAFWPDGRRRTMAQCPRVRAADFLFEGAGQGCTFVLREALFARVRRFCIAHLEDASQLHYHDWMTYLLARAWGARWVFDGRPALDYRQHAGNEIGARGGLAAVRRRVAQIRNGWYGRQIAHAAALYGIAHPGDALVGRAAQLLHRDDGPRRRLALATFAWRHGRRRRVDRAVLVLSVLLGWI